MYYPYLRGKQFELIALRELVDLLAENRLKIFPVIEPVKNSATLRKALQVLKESNLSFSVIVNPQVGDLTNNTGVIIDILHQELHEYSNFQPGIIVDEKTNIAPIIEKLNDFNLGTNGLTIVHNGERDDIGQVLETIEHFGPIRNNIINFRFTGKRYYRSFPAATRVSLDDYFRALNRNKDYLTVGDSIFSEEHLYFENDGYKGFGDYLTIGDSYTETGALPYAVAIHMSYLSEERKIRVKHFVSDSNDDQSDVAGKFAEALQKLISWVNDNNINTQAIEELKTLHNNGHFPGLGSLKKLSVMNHIEVVLSAF